MKKILSINIKLLTSLFLAITLISMISVIVYAETASLEMPRVEEITSSQIAETKNLFYDDSYTLTEEDYTLNYRYYLPEDMTDEVPLIIFLHGRGERGDDNDRQLDKAILRPLIEDENSQFHNAMIVAPQCPLKENNNGWVNLFTDESLDYSNYSVDEIDESVECKAIVALIEQICDERNVDSKRVYLIGISQGAVGTWDLLARHSELFAAAVPICGVGDPEKAEIYADVPIYAFHGELDTLVPYESATPLLYDAIDAVGKDKMNFVSFSDGSHVIWDAAIVFEGTDSLPALEDWLFAQSQSSKLSFTSLAIGITSVFTVSGIIAAAIIFIKEKKSKK